MRKEIKRAAALGLSVCLAAASLSGCAKKKELDMTAEAVKVNDTSVTAGELNFFLRYQQAAFENVYGAFLKSYYGDDLFNADLDGSGVSYGVTFRGEVIEELEKMVLAEQHAEEYEISLTEDEKKAITDAAAAFISANGEEVLNRMSATQENVERVLTLMTISNKIEPKMSADVDTEVPDEEAAQRTVSYVRFDAVVEEETEAESEADTEAGTEAAEADTEAVQTSEAAEPGTEEAETDTEAAQMSEEVTEAGTEKTEAETAAVETEAETKTESADTEAETESVSEAAEAETEAASEAAEAGTEGVSEAAEAETEEATEAETEDEATIAAKAETLAKAEAFLAEAMNSDDFETLAQEAAEADEHASTYYFTFGKDDTYPDAAIIEATEDLEDGSVVEEVVNIGSAYYVLHVDDAFDEEATADKKEEIVNQRKNEAVSALYEEWLDSAEIAVDTAVTEQLIFDISLTVEVPEEETEATSEAATEAAEEVTEAVTEAATEAATEAVSEAAAEAATEA